ncbi:MAG: helix-turn-helix domain-containing protein [Bacteroidetes bacterium]|jgi:excisionase family DNA binding protein|nr:helix-turn-helix domain-containing protein [Bacteroidota bacterium]MBT4411961.1 helix-turn-helix domain-containing protein [Bacteroidota bacterium]MBT7464577.1 helix-turn-helix domain-containing protein [Bacteroidota bacterium]
MEDLTIQLLKKQEKRLDEIEELLKLSKRVLNLEELCLLTGLSKSHIYKLTCYGKIPYYKQSKHLFFDRTEVEAWLKQHRYSSSDDIDKEASKYVTLNQKGGRK